MKESMKLQKSVERKRKAEVAEEKRVMLGEVKMRKAIVDLYEHDYKIYKQEEEFKKNYKTHLHKAICGLWIHVIRSIQIYEEFKEIIFRSEYKTFIDRVKRARQVAASRNTKAVIQRFLVKKHDRSLDKSMNMLLLLADVLSRDDRVGAKARQLLGTKFFTKQMCLKLSIRRETETYIAKIKGMQGKFRKHLKRRHEIFKNLELNWHKCVQNILLLVKSLEPALYLMIEKLYTDPDNE